MSDVLYKCTIKICPVTKKNHGRIIWNKTLKRHILLPSEQFEQYQKDARWFIKELVEPIKQKVNVKALYYMKTKRKVDISNLNNALHDVLVHYKVVEDDDCNIIAATDGSRVRYDKENPRTELEITVLKEEQ